MQTESQTSRKRPPKLPRISCRLPKVTPFRGQISATVFSVRKPGFVFRMDDRLRWVCGHIWDSSPGGGGVLPHMGYIGTCRGIGYGF